MISEAELGMLAEDLSSFYADPVGYVMWAFPWGQPGTTLEKFKGPKKWQRKFLERLATMVKERGFNGVDPVEPIRMARASGHGIGKSALTAWLIKWIMETRPYSKGVTTANTSDQLRTKTWAELGKWHNMSVTKQFFEYHATRGGMCIRNDKHPETWRCDALTCKEENSESFAGQHAATSTPFYIFDESSGIPEKIFEVAQGGLTDGEPMFFMFGNPTRNTGFFRQAFGRYRHRWDLDQIDSRTVEGTNKALFDEWVKDYGEDSDFVRVRIKGQFPRAAVTQFIPSDIVEAAMGRKLHPQQYNFAPRIIGIDVAWEGDDRSSIFYRQGLAAKLLFSGVGIEPEQLGTLGAQYEDEYKADAVFVDRGAGAGVIVFLRGIGRTPIPINFGSSSSDPAYFNKRAQMWGGIKEWLLLGGSLPDEQEMLDDLIGVEYQRRPDGSIQLEKKKDMKKRGLASPDLGDSLGLTFAAPVHRLTELEKAEAQHKNTNVVQTEYDLFA